MKAKNKRLKTLLLFLVPIFTGAAIIFYNLKDNMVFFYSPTEILDRSDNIKSVVRLGGMVKKGSVSKENTFFNGANVEEVSFIITDFNNEIAEKLLFQISNQVEIRSTEYIQKYISSDLKVGAVLFDRERKIRSIGYNSKKMFSKIFTFKS